MSLAPRRVSQLRRSIFSDGGENVAKLSLITAIYFDRTKQALAIIDADPEQINVPDPFAGLTALHVGVFRQNVEIVECLAKHPATQFDIQDRFGRLAIDMCIYSKNNFIFEALLQRTYTTALDTIEHRENHSVVRLKPRYKTQSVPPTKI